MTPTRPLFAMLTALFCMSSAYATDLVTYPIAEALATQAAREKLDPQIKLNFAKSSSDVVRGSRRDEWRAVSRNRRPANGVSHPAFPESNMTDKELCQLGFVQALQELQTRARMAGVTTVDQITSGWTRSETASDSIFTCAMGVATIGIQLRAKGVQR